MNEVSHIGFSQIQELYEQHVKEIDDALLHSKKAKCSTGMPGEPLPYQLRTDLPITCVVFLCFFLIIYALKNGKKYLHQHLKGFFRHKERAGLFDETSSFDIRYSLTLGSISCISASLFIYDFFPRPNRSCIKSFLTISFYACTYSVCF